MSLCYGRYGPVSLVESRKPAVTRPLVHRLRSVAPHGLSMDYRRGRRLVGTGLSAPVRRLRIPGRRRRDHAGVPQQHRRTRQFADLVATAIANTQARDELRRLADEQAALRRVATLVARAAASSEIFSVVTEEVGRWDGSLARISRP